MALRHPHAFPAIATAPLDAPPVLDYAKRILRLHAAQGVSQTAFVRSWCVIDAFVTGFLLGETTRISDLEQRQQTPFQPEPDDLAADMSTVLSGDSFDDALGVLISGLRGVFPSPAATPDS
jgi:hypothetical protein